MTKKDLLKAIAETGYNVGFGAIKLTQIFNQLKALYLKAKNEQSQEISSYIDEHQRLESEYYSHCITKQILFSDWYAHYKFFWQHQIEWINEQKKFTFWRDKVPLSLSMTIVLSVIMLIAFKFEVVTLLCTPMSN